MTWLGILIGTVAGGFLGVLVGCLGAANKHSRMRDRISSLTVALGKLTRAVQHNAAALADSRINEALRLARGELER